MRNPPSLIHFTCSVAALLPTPTSSIRGGPPETSLRLPVRPTAICAFGMRRTESGTHHRNRRFRCRGAAPVSAFAAAAAASSGPSPSQGGDGAKPVPRADPRLVARSVLPSVALVMPVGVRNATSRGSGFVVDLPASAVDFGDDGGENVLHLLTAAHVAAPGHRLDVSFPSGAESTEATVVGRDTRADLALLRVKLADGDEQPAPPAPLAISDAADPEVGTPAFAVGYPSGGIRGAAMTSGIVCAPAYGLGYFDVSPDDARNNETENGEKGEGEPLSLPAFARTCFVVTDAAMAGGMSGGPLVDGEGVVMGVNALVRPDLRALGNYAVDASECRTFLSDLAERLAVSRGDASVGAPSSGKSEGGGYRVMLYNDPFNKRERVSKVLSSIGLNATEAERTMMKAHTRGRSVVREFSGGDDGAREAAYGLCSSLREQDVLVEVERVWDTQPSN